MGSRKASPLEGGSSRLVSRRPSKLQLHKPTLPGFLLLVFAILTAPSLVPAFHDLILCVAGKGFLGIDIKGIGVSAESCSTAELQEMTVSNDTALNISNIFACEEGDFNVSWVGVVSVSGTINIGQGTTVRIFGESAAATSSSSTTGSGSNSNIDSSGYRTDVELELESLSSGLNLPQGLMSAAVGSVGRDGDNNSSVSSGSIFFVDGGVLHLESLAVRQGNSTEKGGGIHAENSNISVSGCEFEENFAEDHGGGIYATLSTLIILDSVFRANHAGPPSFAGDNNADSVGGGIACENTLLYLNGCLFDENYANKKGGGVSIDEGQVSVVNSLFFNNLAGSSNVIFEEAVGEGAALYFSNCNRSFDGFSSCGVNDTTFIYNAVAKKGGAVTVASGPSYIEFHRCVVDNTTTGWPFEDDPQGEGGAFSLGSGTTMVLEDCVVKKNYCGRKGGVFAVTSGTDWENPGGTIIMRNSTFTGNIAEYNSAGVINLGEFATARFEGQGNSFTGNVCGLYGGVLAATTNTRVTVEGGLFQGNEADEGGGVFWVKGILDINGGNFSENYVSENSGGVVFASDYSSVTLSDGHFEGNDALNGGVAFVELHALLLVQGGVYTGNIAQNGGGVFWGEDGGDLKIIGGVFTGNVADFGGFLYAEADGITSCEGASVVGNIAVNGGAIYAVDGAEVDCACHLIRNEALSGPAIYARVGSTVKVRSVNVSDNVVARGSAMFIVSSTLYTYRVNFQDSTGSFDLSAVQSDQDSMYIAEETAFVGFQGETVVYSEGILYLDDCDFSESSASVLVYSDLNTTTVVRNAVLGDSNFEAVIEDASAASEISEKASLINVELTCSESGSPCSVGPPCLEGDLGVYCQCYERNSSSKQICLDGDPEGLFLSNITAPPTTYHPKLLEGDILLALGIIDSCGTCLSITTNSTTTTSLSNSGGVVWNMMATSQEPISWTVFPSVGLLHPGQSITLRVVGLPSEDFDGPTNATFAVDALGGHNQEEESSSNSLRESEDNEFTCKMEVTFYHCEAGSFWNVSNAESSSSCGLCGDIKGGVEGVICSGPGVSTLKLPLQRGYWRASLSNVNIVVRECFNKEACIGGIANRSVNEYCNAGYEGPFCGVCASGYGRGSGNTCHKCTEEFKGAMYFVSAVATLLTIIIIVLLGVYLVGGRVAVSQVMLTTTSGRMLQRRGFRGYKLSRKQDFGSKGSASSSTFSRISRSRDKIISAEGSNAVVSGSSSSATAAECDGFRVADPDGVKSVEASGSSNDLSLSKVSGSFCPLPAQGLARESKHPPASAEEKCVSGDGRPCAGFDPSRVSVPVLAPTPVGERGSGRNEKQEEKEEGPDDVEEEKTAVTMIGKFLGRLPFSKLKIVIVVWQISSAFAEITKVPFPKVYEKFLSIIGIFLFDLSWILSASCLTDGLDFYYKLCIVTIGPLFLLGLLGITFYLGSRYLRSAHRGKFAENNTEISGNNAVYMSCSSTAISATVENTKKRQHDATNACDTLRESSSTGACGGRDHRLRNCNAMTINGTTSSDTSTNIYTETESGLRKSIPSTNSTVEDVTSNELGKRERDGENANGRGISINRRSVRMVLKDGPGDDPNSEQNHFWMLLARHTTVTLIILYLIYSQVSTVVFQTFVCEKLSDTGERFLRADFRIDCDTPKHKAFEIYAAIMICVYPLGIPAAFCYFLVKQNSRINPPIEESVRDLRGEDHVVNMKVEERREDPTVAPTSFLWAAYYPDRYYFEVCECIRRLLLTGVLVFLEPDTAGQVAYSCLFAFISLFAFELLVPHIDQLDRVLYRTGCLVIFFTNFLALLIKAEVTNPDSGGPAAYSVGLIVANVFLVILSIWWNTWATIKAMFSQSHVQGITIGVDIIAEDKMDSLVTLMKAKGNKGRDNKGEVKIENGNFETAPVWDRDPSVGKVPTNISSNRCYDRGGREGVEAGNNEDSVLDSPISSGSQAPGASEGSLNASLTQGRQLRLQGHGASSLGWTGFPQNPTSVTTIAGNIYECGPKSRGFPYSSGVPVAVSSTCNPVHTPVTPTGSASRDHSI